MRVTRIEIFGFKSFMDRLVLPLEGGITGVVGPNGCGKSNVVDALRWVLGETKASSLRGEILEDIIFNGTENLRPLGLAEVTLTLRSAGQDFFSDLLDPATSLDAETSQLLQNLEEASNKVEELAASQEEAAGENEGSGEQEIAEAEPSAERPKLKVIKGNLGAAAPVTEESEKPAANAERKRQQTASYLSRFSWLKSCNEVQVTRRLYRSGESEFFINRVPCRLKDMKELYRALGLGARAYTIVAQGEVSRIVSAKPEDRRLIIEEAAGVSGFRDKIQTAKRRLEDTAVNISRLDDLITEVTRQVATLKKQAQRARDRKELKETIYNLESKLYSDKRLSLKSRQSLLEEQLSAARRDEEMTESKLHSVQAMEHEARSSLMSVDVETDEVRLRIDSIREELNARAEQRSSGQSKIKELKAYAVAANAEKERLEGMFSTLESRKQDCLQEIDKLSAEQQILVSQLAEHERFINSDELESIAAQIDGLKDRVRENERAMRDVRDEYSMQKGRLEQVNNQIAAFSPLTQLRNTFSADQGGFLSSLHTDYRVLADVINVDKDYSLALQAVLREKAEYLLADDPHQLGVAFLEKKRELGLDGSKGLGLGAIRSGLQSVENESDQRLAGFTPLRRYVGTSEPDAGLLDVLLADVYICESAGQATEFFRQNVHSPVMFVTKEGDLIGSDSFSSFKQETGLISLKTSAGVIEETCAQLAGSLSELEEIQRDLNSQIAEKEELQSKILNEIQQRQQALREVSNAHASVAGRLESARRVLNQIEQDVVSSRSQKEALVARLEVYRREEEGLLAELQALVSEQDEEIKKELETLKGEHSRLDQLRKAGHEKLSQAAGELDSARDNLDSARSAVSSLQLESQKLSMELNNLEQKFIEMYGEREAASLEMQLSELSALDQDQRAEAEQELSRLKARLVREGDVDSSSIERYEEENSRLEELSQQRSDLKEAAATLERTIELLIDTSKNRFMSTFQAIRRNFSALVPRVYGGGKGDLELIDPTKPLETGVEISVRPPGKKLRSIDLLSGGEKALAATSLIFAMFLERPSPLCVLDEVDAPLDEANLVRLVSLIKEMSKKTQFIMITHNKQSMVASDNLIGVTMQEPGASKVISVSLQEAFSQVA